MGILDDIENDMYKENEAEQKKIPEAKPVQRKVAEPVINTETVFSREDELKAIDNTFSRFRGKGVNLRRREKKMIRNMEHDTGRSTQGIVIGLAVVGLVFLLLLNNMVQNEAIITVIMLVGAMMFIPVGMIVGWVMLDPVMRCKILRKVSKNNYGIVNFVGKGKRMVSKIKNFDYGLIWQGDLCWVLTRDKVYQMTKDGNACNEGNKIDPDSVVTLVDTVPVVFVDMDSMEPLSIVQKDRTPVYPSEIGPSCKAWMDIQRAKLLSHKKTMDILLIIAIVAAIGAVVVGVLTMNKVEELTKVVQAIQNSLAQTPP